MNKDSMVKLMNWQEGNFGLHQWIALFVSLFPCQCY